MNNLRRFFMILLALVIVLGGTGISFQPAQASGCAYYHIVSYGESLSWIGRYYGINWKTLASINGIPAPYTIYAGQKICLTGTGTGYYGYSNQWSYTVSRIVKDTTVAIQTSNFPSNVKFEAFIGRQSGATVDWVKVADVDSDRGGKFKQVFNIPPAFAGASRLAVRMVQAKKGTTVDRWFNNYDSTIGTGGPGGGWYYGTIPTIWIVGVVRNSSVTITTNSFPPGLVFDVLMGPMGTRGVGGYHVGTLNSGAGGTLTATFSIPAPLHGSQKIAIRTQNLATGYYSYNWFWNNTTP
ncbi:MAG: LysM domain-containing protein [Chloroflexota bacterium]